MIKNKATFALFFGNRGVFPASLIDEAREELPRLLKQWGHDVLTLERDATRYGGVETAVEARKYARFLSENRGRFDGVILCLPNFGDENGAAPALQEAGVPIFVQAYPDELDKMSPALRRDAFCGKISIMDVFQQYGIRFSVGKPHVVKPDSARFESNVDTFNRICRIVSGLNGMVVGQIGSRTTPFKTVRIDELALQKHGITVETFDLSDVFARMRALSPSDGAYQDKQKHLQGISTWDGVPDVALDNLVRLGLVLDGMIEEYGMHAISIRCWTELQEQFGISPCLITGDLMDRHIPAACEVDTGSAVAMHILGLAAGSPTMILDWNNNYGEDDDKCILFHCGNAPSSMMSARGKVSDHAILSTTIGAGRGYGCNTGRIAPGEFTFCNLLTDSGRIKMYLGQGSFTDDEIPEDFFGVAGVAQIEKLQDVLMFMGNMGHRHHVALASGHVQEAIREALEKYIGFDVALPQNGDAAR